MGCRSLWVCKKSKQYKNRLGPYSKENGDNPGEILTEEDMRLREKANLESALQQTDWKIYGAGGAAELLGLKPTTLLSQIKKMKIAK